MNEVLNRNILLKLKRDVGGEVVPQFLHSVRVEITHTYLAMEAVLVDRDLANLAMKAHTMKAACGAAGLIQLERLTQALQVASEQKNMGRVSHIMGTLPSIVLLAFGALDNYLSDLETP